MVFTISDGPFLAPRGVHDKRRTCSPTDGDRHDAHDGHDGNVDNHNVGELLFLAATQALKTCDRG